MCMLVNSKCAQPSLPKAVHRSALREGGPPRAPAGKPPRCAHHSEGFGRAAVLSYC
jgi:hypothetical protein